MLLRRFSVSNTLFLKVVDESSWPELTDGLDCADNSHSCYFKYVRGERLLRNENNKGKKASDNEQRFRADSISAIMSAPRENSKDSKDRSLWVPSHSLYPFPLFFIRFLPFTRFSLFLSLCARSFCLSPSILVSLIYAYVFLSACLICNTRFPVSCTACTVVLLYEIVFWNDCLRLLHRAWHRELSPCRINPMTHVPLMSYDEKFDAERRDRMILFRVCGWRMWLVSIRMYILLFIYLEFLLFAYECSG